MTWPGGYSRRSLVPATVPDNNLVREGGSMGAHDGQNSDGKGGDSNKPQGGSHSGGSGSGGQAGDGNRPGK